MSGRLTVLLLGLIYVKAVTAVALSPPGLWPNPASVTWGSTNLGFDVSKFTFHTDSVSPVLARAIARYQHILASSTGIHKQIVYPGPPPPTPPVKANAQSLTIVVDNDKTPLAMSVNESYTLTVGPVSHLRAPTVWGALHGLETFSQLCQWNGTLYVIQNTPVVIQDAPKFPWRGMLIDTARHYLSLDTIKQTIDLLSMNKMNVLHWHMVDAESFPIEIKSRPDLQKKGAWDDSAIYSQKDLVEIIQYAMERGVRVVPEIDTPGHVYSWGHAYPSIILACSKFIERSKDFPRINSVPLDMTNPETYEVVNDVIREVSEIFPDDFIHLGGDEISSGCVNEFPRIKEWMKSHGMNITSYADLVKYYEENLIAIVAKNGNKKMIFWQEIFEMFKSRIHSTLPQGTIINVWIREGRAALLKDIVNAGYPALVSSGWYLDQQVPNVDPRVTHYLWLDTWQDFYQNNPLDGLNSLPVEKQKLVLGGEACQWGEQVDDESIYVRSWPRAAAAAEHLWSPSLQTIDEAFHRMAVHRCRLYLRGFAVSPLRPDFCRRG